MKSKKKAETKAASQSKPIITNADSSLIQEKIMEMDNIPGETNNLVEIKSRHGFVFHGAKGEPLFPTHTHGLTEMGMPEFIYELVAFPPEDSALLIFCAYIYLSKPENADQLENIINGITIRLTSKDFFPGINHNYLHIFCFRKVSPGFKDVQLAYSREEIASDMLFVQMYEEM